MSPSSASQDQYLLDVFGGFVGNAVDVGAADGLFYSNTLALEQHGWDVLCIEANPVLAKMLVSNRKRAREGAAGERVKAAPFYVYEGGSGPGRLCSYSSLDRNAHAQVAPFHVVVKPLDLYIEEAGFEKVDLLCIDVEGSEARVLRGLSFWKYKPTMIVVEAFQDFRNQDAADLLRIHGYEKVNRIEFDDFYRRRDEE